MKKKLVSLLLCACMTASLAACGSSSSGESSEAASEQEEADTASESEKAETEASTDEAASDGSSLDIGVLVWKFSDTYASTVRSAIESYAKSIGAEQGITINLDMQDGNNDQAQQNNQAEVMFSKKPDLVVINLVDVNAGQQLVDLAKEYDVPVLFYNKEPTTDGLVTDAESIFIGTKIEEAGEMQGEIMEELWSTHPEYDKNGDGTVQYLMFEGEVSNPEAIARTEYSVKKAEELGLSFELLGGENMVADWDTSTAQNQMTALWANYGSELEAVFCNNDDMALGVIAALNEVGYNLGDDSENYVPIIGVDATDAAMEAIKNGKMAASVKQDGDAMGKAIVELAINGALGKDWLDGTSYEMADDGYSIRIPYAKVTE